MFSALLTERGCLAQEKGQWKAETLLLLCCPSWLALKLAGAQRSAVQAGCLQVDDATKKDTAGR